MTALERVREMPTERALDGARIADMKMSIRETGFLLPIVTDGGVIIDGVIRAAAARSLGLTDVPTIEFTGRNPDPVQSAAIYRSRKQHGAAARILPVSYKTLDRILKVVDVAADMTLPVQVRTTAAAGVADIRAGRPVNGVLNAVNQAIDSHEVTEKYPELSGIPRNQALRMAAYLDSVPAPNREREIRRFLQLVRGSGDPSGHAVEAYRRLREIGTTAHPDRISEVTGALYEAGATGSVTPEIERLAERVAESLEQAAANIRTQLRRRA